MSNKDAEQPSSYLANRVSPEPSKEWLDEHEQARIDRWRNATDLQRGEALVDLLNLMDHLIG